MSIFIKGMFFQMVHGLLTEYNPEIADGVKQNLSFVIDDVKPNKWYPVEDMYEYVKNLSEPASLAIAKRVYPVIDEQTPLMKDCKSPLDVIKMMNDITPFTVKGDPLPEYNLIESGEDYARVESVHSLWKDFPSVEKGFFHGICNIFKFVRVNINVMEGEKENTRIFEVKWQ